MPQEAAITDDEGSLPGQLKSHGLRTPFADRHSDAALFKVPAGLPETFEHKSEMAEVRVRVILRQSETNKNRLMQQIGLVDCVLESVVPVGPLRLLHPVKDKASFGYRFLIKSLNAVGRDVCRLHLDSE